MVNKTLLSTTAGELPSSKQTRKFSPIEFDGFAGFLTRNTEQSVRQFKDFGRKDAELKSSSKSETQDVAVKKADRDDSRSSRSHENTTPDKKTHDASDAKETGSSRDSRKSESAQTTQSVDGGENETTPGTSTEAAVNAQSTSDSANNALDTAVSDESTLSTPQQVDELQQLIQKLAAESPSQATVENTDSIQLSAKSIERNNSVLQTNLNLTDQKILFETGLAEHFVRLLTDQFDQLKNSVSQKGESTQIDTNTTTATASLGSLKADNSQNNLNLTFQQTTPTPTSENNASENMTKIMHIIRSNLGRRQSQLTVQLDPPELGKMRVDIKVMDNNLQLAITTETAEAKQMLSSRMETLRSSLEQNGIHLSKFEIVTRSENAAPNQNEQQFQDQSHNGNGTYQQHQQQSDSEASPQPASNESLSESTLTLTGVDSSDKTINLVA